MAENQILLLVLAFLGGAFGVGYGISAYEARREMREVTEWLEHLISKFDGNGNEKSH